LQVTEEMGIHNEWYNEAKSQTLETLPEFLNHLLNDYEHDYGTIVHAMAAGILATFHAMNEHEQGGITGFQASILMWFFINKLMHWDGIPKRIVLYEDMLYPQHRYKFEKTINPETWEWLQEEARKRLADYDPRYVAEGVVKHWKEIANGKVPFGYKVEVRDHG